MHAAIFARTGKLTDSLTVEANSAEECLSLLQDKMSKILEYIPTLNFRPLDGMIFWQELSSTVPIGVLYQKGYDNGIRM